MKLLFVRIVLMTILLHFEISMVLFLKEKLLYLTHFQVMILYRKINKKA